MAVILLDEGMMDWVTCQLRSEKTNEAFEVMLSVVRMFVWLMIVVRGLAVDRRSCRQVK